MAHKKGVGSTKNGRDSMAQRLGVKRADGRRFWPATSWSGSAAPTSCRARTLAKGSDDTLFALVDGTVRFERVGKSGKKCSVKL